MSLPPNMAEGSDAPTRDEEQPEPMSFTLVVVSPSVGVPGPLNFPHLPAATSVKELKAKIRDVLPSKPADESQRLIHRGRMLARETETMMDIFGSETLANPESQTLHLVLKPTGVDPSSTHPSTPLVGPQRIPTPITTPARPQSTPTNPNQGMPAQLPLPGFQQMAQHQLLHQADHLQNMMAQRLQHLQQETVRLQQDMMSIEQRSRALAAGNPALFHHPQTATGGQAPTVPGLQNTFHAPLGGFRSTQPMPASVQNLINQQQRERAAEGRHGALDSGAIPHGHGFPQPASSGRASPNILRPDHTTTHTREGVGPNGERWQITVNETTTTFPVTQLPHHHQHQHSQGYGNNPVLDNLQAILRNADRVLAAQTLQNNAEHVGSTERAASNPPPTAASTSSAALNRASSESAIVVPPSITTGSSPSSSTLLNQAFNVQIPFINPAIQASTTSNPNSNVDPVVYILSSPQGPRALLLSNSDTFYSPRQPSRRRRHDSPAPLQGALPAVDGVQPPRFQGLPEFRNRLPDRRRARHDQNGNAQPQERDRVEPVAGHAHANPGAGALAAQIGPMLWLIVRLAGFVWFFTAGNSSWTRFFMVSALAVGVFIVNTGFFNGIAEQLWGPIRRHIEALIPLAGPEAALVPAANAAIPQQRDGPPPAGNEQRPRRRRGELDPAEVAAHLIEQHRQANAGWLMAQIRRAEHAALLFLASLVPGVGERHIAAREAEASAAEAERHRRIEAAAAAENPSEEVGSDQATDSGNNQDNQDSRTQTREEDAPPAQPQVDV